jgi:hypothetical protein
VKVLINCWLNCALVNSMWLIVVTRSENYQHHHHIILVYDVLKWCQILHHIVITWSVITLPVHGAKSVLHACITTTFVSPIQWLIFYMYIQPQQYCVLCDHGFNYYN